MNAPANAITGGYTGKAYPFHSAEKLFVDMRDWIYLASPDYIEADDD